MEEMLPDYVFGRLLPDEKEKFELSLSNYPDLSREVQEVRKVFSKLERLDFDNYLERKTRNIPIKVSEKLQQKRNPLNIFARPGFVSLVAGIGVILIAISIFFSKKDTKGIVQNLPTTTQIVKSSPEPIFPQLKDVDKFAEEASLDVSDFNTVVGSVFPGDYTSSFELASDYLDELVSRELVELVPSNTKFQSSIFDNRFFDLLNVLDEKDFQQLIEELKDVQI